jgi:sugar/nucleoside kinase (ribokinase family)
MTNERGVICAGSIITDYVVVVDRWPSESSLSTIHRQQRTGGGGPWNVIKDLRAMDTHLPLSLIGLLGNDDNGRWLLNDCQNSNIDISQLHVTDDQTPTSYTYVISVESTGRRTFFNQPGTNALLNEKHFDFNYLVNEKHHGYFYLGYITLLEQLDRVVDNETMAARILQQAKHVGLVTIVDFVSVDNPYYSAIARLTLPYVDHLILNEVEVGLILERSFEQATVEDIEHAGRILINQFGVQRTVTIHFDCGAICLTRTINETIECFLQGSLRLPQGYIKGAVGAGDAFAAGIIYGLYRQWTIPERLRCGICTAAMCLTDETPYAGVGSIEQCLQLEDQFIFRTLNSSSSIRDMEK